LFYYSYPYKGGAILSPVRHSPPFLTFKKGETMTLLIGVALAMVYLGLLGFLFNIILKEDNSNDTEF